MNLRRLAAGDNGFPLSRDLRPRMVDPRDLRPLGEATREHSPKQIRKLIRSVRQFGLVYPALVDEAERVIAGGALVLAAIEMGLRQVPVVTITGLSEAQGRMLRLALNRLAEDSRWDRDALRRELSQILEIENDIEIADTGFETAEIDAIVLDDGSDEEDELPSIEEGMPPVSQLGDQWILGEHRVLCADACDPKSFQRLLGRERAQMVFTDPPYNVPIDGHVSGLGVIKHPNFVMGAGELSPEQFEMLLRTSLGLAAQFSMNGAITFCCMDWRGLQALL